MADIIEHLECKYWMHFSYVRLFHPHNYSIVIYEVGTFVNCLEQGLAQSELSMLALISITVAIVIWQVRDLSEGKLNVDCYYQLLARIFA